MNERQDLRSYIKEKVNIQTLSRHIRSQGQAISKLAKGAQVKKAAERFSGFKAKALVRSQVVKARSLRARKYVAGEFK